MLFEWMSDTAAWERLATLIVLEIALGISNLVFVPVLHVQLPPQHHQAVHLLGNAVCPPVARDVISALMAKI